MNGSGQGHGDDSTSNQTNEADSGRGLQTGTEAAEDGSEATEEVKADGAERIAKIGAYTKALESYDKIVTTMAGGALTLSVAFMHQIAPNPTRESLAWLRIGWGGFVFTLGIHVLSMLLGHKAMEADLAGDNETASALGEWTTRFNVAASLSLLVGFVGLIAFADNNLRARSTGAVPAERPRLESPRQ